MPTLLLFRGLEATVSLGYHLSMGAAAAVSTPGDTAVKVAIITGIFTTVGALIAAGTVLFRSRNPDLSELLGLHERVTVVEQTTADTRADLAGMRVDVTRNREDIQRILGRRGKDSR